MGVLFVIETICYYYSNKRRIGWSASNEGLVSSEADLNKGLSHYFVTPILKINPVVFVAGRLSAGHDTHIFIINIPLQL